MKELGKIGIGLGLALAFTSPATTAFAEEDQSPPEMAAESEGEESEGLEGAEESQDPEEASNADSITDWVHPMRRNLISSNINSEGAMGFHSIASAISPGALRFQVGLLGQGSGGSSVVRLNDQNRAFGGNVVVNSSLIEEFGFHLALNARNNVNNYGRPQAMLSQGDLSFGFTGRYEVADGIWLGGDLSFFVPAGFGNVGLSASSTSLRPRLMGSFDFDALFGTAEDLVIPLLAHLNFGFLIDNSENLVPEGYNIDRVERFAYGISAYNLLEIGIGLEAPMPYVTPFLAWNLGIPLGPDDGVCSQANPLDCVAEIGPAAYPQVLSLGAKTEPLENLGLHAGIDFGLTSSDAEGLPVTAPFTFQFGLSWRIDPTPRIQIEEREIETLVEVGEPRGYLLARLIDERTGEPVADARINYVDREESGHFSRALTGVFRTYDFEPGEEVRIEISHPRYEVAYATFTIEEGSQELEILLEPLPMAMTLRGQVVGMNGAPAIGAVVVLTGREGESVEVEVDEEGRFEGEVSPGHVTVAAFLEGFLTAGGDYRFGPDHDEELAIAFVREESQVVVGVAETQVRVQERIDFESGGSNLLEQSAEVLDVVAAVLLENPQIRRVQIQGHTDDAGDEDYNLELTQRRAESVKSALLERGISEERLEAEGYGASMPLVPNTSRRNRNLNRRIEFRILE